MDTVDLPMQQIRVKAVHNSYGVAKLPIADQLTWHADRPYKGGSCGVELDIVQDVKGWSWSVQHGGKYSKSTKGQLSAYLTELDRWSAEQGGAHSTHFRAFRYQELTRLGPRIRHGV